MIYRILCSGNDIYGNDLDHSVLSPSLELELNSAGTLNFTMPPQHEHWILPSVFKDEIDVIEGDKIIWFGRPLQITRDWNNQKKVVCEGALAYFNDSIQRPFEYDMSKTVLYEDSETYPNKTGFFNQIIDIHNNQVPVNRQIHIGNITVDNEYVYRNTDYNTTADCLQQMCLDTNGGYFILRKEIVDGVETRFIDWVKDMPGSTDQQAAFGLNLLDVSQDLNGADICTVLIPTGADDLLVNKVAVYDESNPSPYDSEGHTLLHGDSSDEIIHKEGFEKYGRVLKQKDWSDATDKDTLFQYAAEWLKDQNTDIPTIECSAADLHYLKQYKDMYSAFFVGQKVQVTSGPHGLDRYLPIYKLSMQLDTGVKKMTIGTPPKRELTDIVKSSGGSTRSSSSGSSSGGSSGGSTSVPVKDVRVKKPGASSYKTVVTKKIAQIDLSDLGSGDVTDVQVNGTSVVDEDGVAKVVINLDEYATDTELATAVSQLQRNFQNGVDNIYDAVVAKGSTPESHSLSDVVEGINNIPSGSGAKNTIYLLKQPISLIEAPQITEMISENFVPEFLEE